MVLIDSNIILDIWDRDPVWSGWSSGQLRSLSTSHDFAINAVIYAEISVRFDAQATLDQRLADLEIHIQDIPRESAFLAGKAFVKYRLLGGKRIKVLPDFFIGAHASVLGCLLLTRDSQTYSTYFPGVHLIAP